MKVVIIGLPLRVCYQITGQLLPSSSNMDRKEETLILSKGKSQAVFAKRLWKSSCLTGGALERLIRAKCQCSVFVFFFSL
jgi:hypothetical protein